MTDGVSVSISVFGDDHFKREIRRMSDRARNMKPPLRVIAVKMLRVFEDEFSSEGWRGAGGWDALQPTTIRKRGSSHPILDDTGAFKSDLLNPDNINISERGLHFAPDGYAQEVGRRHQSGTSNMPARPFNLTREDEIDYTKTLQRWLVTGRL